MAKMKFCKQMGSAIESSEIPVKYVRKYNEIGIKVFDGGSSFIAIDFCPWCGNKLPESLREDWFDQLENMGLDPLVDDIPKKFKSGAWHEN